MQCQSQHPTLAIFAMEEMLRVTSSHATIAISCCNAVYGCACAFVRSLRLASVSAELHGDIREVNLILLNGGRTTVCKQMANFKNNIKFVPTRISLIASFERVLAGARELSSMAKQLQSHDMQ
jgi:hypothetical protein